MYGVSKISSEENIMLVTFPGAQYSAQSLADHLNMFAENNVIVDMISQSAPHGSDIDFSLTASYDNFATVMKAIPHAVAQRGEPAPRISGGYAKISLFGAEMVNACGVAARALTALAEVNVEISLVTTSDLDISLLVRSEDEDVALAALTKAYAL